MRERGFDLQASSLRSRFDHDMAGETWTRELRFAFTFILKLSERWEGERRGRGKIRTKVRSFRVRKRGKSKTGKEGPMARRANTYEQPAPDAEALGVCCQRH